MQTPSVEQPSPAKPMSLMTVREMMLAAMMAAITSVMGLIPGIPLPGGVPIVLQNIGPMLAGSLLGKKTGGISILVFVILVAVGAPLLSGGRGGMGAILGPSGGYIVSWPLVAFLIGWLVGSWKLTFARLFLANLAGSLLNYLFGTLWLAFVGSLGPREALMVGVIPFIPGDMAKMLAASFLALGILRAYPVLRSRRS